MRKKGNSFYYVSGSTWEPLGQDYSVALLRWAENEGMPTKETLNSAIDLYFASSKFESLSDNTKTTYKSRAKNIRKIMGMRTCKSIEPLHIYAYMDKNPSNAGANQGLVVLYHALEEARKRGWIRDNPAVKIEKHGTKRRGRYITDEEYRKIYEAGTDLVKAVMKLNYLIGQRPIDIFKLRLQDITDEGIFIQQKKTDKKQLFTWTKELREAVDQAKALPRPVRNLTTLFCKTTGKPYDTREFRYQWKAACKLAGVENAQFRDIRAKAGTDAYNGGQDHQAILGHTTKAMSDTYVKQFKVDKVEPLRKKI